MSVLVRSFSCACIGMQRKHNTGVNPFAKEPYVFKAKTPSKPAIAIPVKKSNKVISFPDSRRDSSGLRGLNPGVHHQDHEDRVQNVRVTRRIENRSKLNPGVHHQDHEARVQNVRVARRIENISKLYRTYTEHASNILHKPIEDMSAIYRNSIESFSNICRGPSGVRWCW